MLVYIKSLQRNLNAKVGFVNGGVNLELRGRIFDVRL